jgi:feruloyl esterase
MHILSAAAGFAICALACASLTAQTRIEVPPVKSSLADLKGIAPAIECAQLAGFDLSAAIGVKTRIREATAVADGKPAPYCGVLATIDPAIQVEVRLPLANWTQRFLQTGCGGLCGTLNINVGRTEGCAPATNGEIALASTDMGHSNGPGRGGGDPTWAAENPQTKIDFGYRAEHLTAIAAKALIRQFYGQSPKYSYFSGCSDGGREALMEAERYPEDFNGIAAGAPAMNFITQNTFYHGWNARVNTGADGQAILTSDKLPILHKAVLEACDALDGLKDGLISNPPACKFDPAVTVCKPGQDESTCLTAAQANTAKEIYRGAHDASGHQFVISGPQPGSELAWQGVYVPQGPGAPIFSAGIALGTMKYLTYSKPLAPEYGLKDFPFTQANFEAIAPMHALYDATDPDLSKFAAGGGKLLMYHGWSDPHISPLNSVAYFTAMQKLMGEAKVAQFARLYLFPGGYHCNGGDGPFDFALLSYIMSWVEGGAAPNAIMASHTPQSAGRGGRGGGGRGAPAVASDRTRPVFPYPMTSVYKGSGDLNDAANFEAKPGARVDPAMLNWSGSSFYKAGYEKWCEWTGSEMKCGNERK